jgi:hypothetical protein
MVKAAANDYFQPDKWSVRIMKIKIDKARCVGNARCWAVAADLYPLDDDGYISID